MSLQVTLKFYVTESDRIGAHSLKFTSYRGKTAGTRTQLCLDALVVLNLT